MEIEHVEARHSITANVSGVATHFLVAAGTEREIALAGENNRADLRILMRYVEGAEHFRDRQRTEGIVHFRAVDGYFGDRAVVRRLVTDVFEVIFGNPHRGLICPVPRTDSTAKSCGAAVHARAEQ